MPSFSPGKFWGGIPGTFFPRFLGFNHLTISGNLEGLILGHIGFVETPGIWGSRGLF